MSPGELLLVPFHAVVELISEGGPYVGVIFACGVVLFALVAERGIYFALVLPGQRARAIGRVTGLAERSSWCSRQIRRATISRMSDAMTANLILLRALVPLAPLLGLVGTVSGMIEVFDSMALRGVVDARTMASGVSHAMICTMTGLAVSLSGLYPAYYLEMRARREVARLADRLEE